MPKAAWWVLISGLSTVAVAALQSLGANWIWTPVVIGIIGVGVKVAEVLLTQQHETQTRGYMAFDMPLTRRAKAQTWARKVLW